MAGLLVSVRSVEEALSAVAGGADVIDLKEPGRGPLGRADVAVWREVRRAVPDELPVSVALGELPEWDDPPAAPDDFAGLSFRKLGLSGAGDRWAARWDALRARLGDGPPWVAVAYADWHRAEAPAPDAVLEAARRAGCSGLLIDTWDKSQPSPLGPGEPWAGWVREARRAGLLVALAGGLDAPAILRFSSLRPDLFAVRGAACHDGDRHAPIDPSRVRRLVQLVRTLS